LSIVSGFLEVRFATVFRWNGDMGELNVAEPLK